MEPARVVVLEVQRHYGVGEERRRPGERPWWLHCSACVVQLAVGGWLVLLVLLLMMMMMSLMQLRLVGGG